MTKNNIFFWACDYSRKTGEGNLARKFILENFKNKKKQYKNIKIICLQSKNFTNHKYISPFIGIFNCWKYHLKGNHVGYLNYLPMWNFLIFLLLPASTILGPITGGALYSKKNFTNFFIRRFFFPIFYKISEIILLAKFKRKFIFSTDLLKKNLSKKLINNSEFNYVLKNFSFKKRRKKDIDFLIYYKKNNNKLSFFNYKLVKNLAELNFKIFIVGDNLYINKVKNLGFLSRKKLTNFQERSRYTISSDENIYSLFVIECLENHVKTLIDKRYMKKVKFLREFFLDMNNPIFNYKK